MTPTEGFAGELRRAMQRRGASRADIYKAVGACSTLAKRWIDGAAYPDHGTVVALADHLGWPSLVERSIADRSGTCEGCGAPTMATRGSRPPRYCGDRCIRRLHDRDKRERKRLQVVGVVTRERDRLRAAVTDFCRTCEPEGICRDDECRLRDVSPLPFIPINGLRRAA